IVTKKNAEKASKRLEEAALCAEEWASQNAVEFDLAKTEAIQFSRQNDKKFRTAMERYQVFDAELLAISEALREALHLLKSEPFTTLKIFSDSQNALSILSSGEIGPGMLAAEDTREYHRRLVAVGVEAYFHWVPGHQDVTGNEIADSAATEAAS
ncbi:hypothetical protein EX30DRAFT_293862, partial [Ascodesmis nigricans]